MAELNARNDSFISLLLNVSGKARVVDLQGMTPDDARALLATYRDVHGDLPLALEGDTLSFGSASSAPAAPAAAAVPAAPAPEAFSPAPAPVEPFAPPQPAPAAAVPGADFAFSVPDPAAAAYTPSAPAGEQLPAWMTEEPAPAAPEAWGAELAGSPDDFATSVPVSDFAGEVVAPVQSDGALGDPIPALQDAAAEASAPAKKGPSKTLLVLLGVLLVVVIALAVWLLAFGGMDLLFGTSTSGGGAVPQPTAVPTTGTAAATGTPAASGTVPATGTP